MIMAVSDDVECVLVVDDSPDTLKFLTDVIEETGATVLVSLEGLKALEVLERITPDAILMDAVMPGMDGFETCRRLKKNRKMLHVPVIFMTGLSETEHIVEGFQAGGIDYLVKPLDPNELVARMRVHIANAKLAKSAYLAMDEARRFLFATNSTGDVLWSTPQAAMLLEVAFPKILKSEFQLPDFVRRWIDAQFEADISAPAQLVLINTEQQQTLITYIGRNGPDEFLIRIIEDNFLARQRCLSEAFGLTMREGEVLVWVANGKSNRDIGIILNLSPRTINKHMERVHRKLGVENRTMAAAMALKIL